MASNSSSPETQSARRQQRRRRAVLLLSMVLSPVAMELAVRASGQKGLVMHSEVGKRQRRGKPPFKFVLREGARVEVTYAHRGGSTVRTAVMTINAAGMRGPMPRGGSPQIACIGDSHTFGYGVSDGEPWPEVLESELRQELPEVEVMNFGVGGYGPSHEAARLTQDALPHRPDIVLWQWFMNDVETGADHRAKSLLRQRLEPWVMPFRTDWVLRLRETSVLADLAMHAAYRWCRSEPGSAQRLATRARTSPVWLESLATYREARRAAEAQGARFAMVIHPLVVAAEGGRFASEPLDALIVEFCEEEDIPFVNLSEHLDPADHNALRNSDLDYHPSPTCHALVGRAVADELRKWGWL